MKLKWVATSAGIILGGSFGAVALSAQQGPPSGQGDGGGDRPTEAMLQACIAKHQHQSCSLADDDGNTVSGTCHAPEGLPLACIPAGAGPGGTASLSPPGGSGSPAGNGPPAEGGPPPSQPNTGTPLTSTQAYTLGVLCDYSGNVPNEQIGEASQFQWSCERGQRRLTANGIPDHAIGRFPNPANRNAPTPQSVSFVATMSPVALSGPGGFVKEPVMGLNGVKFDPGTGGTCKDDVTDATQCGLGPGSGGGWRIEALGQDAFDFGEDENNAHVQPGGTYHYHGVPDGMLSEEALAGEEMALIGWAADGFPVYARYGYGQIGMMIGSPQLMQTSYRLKSEPDDGRPPVGVVPMGAFMQDWEYVEGLGDLDECNGRFGSTPEFPEGIYHYYATDAYPYVQRCVKGSTDTAPQREARPQRGGSDEGRGRGRGGRGGERGGERGGHSQ